MSAEIQMWVVILSIILLVIGLVVDKIRPHYLFFSCAFLFVVLRIVPINIFLESFSNQSIVLIFALILFTAGITSNFNIIKGLDRFFLQKNKPKLFLLQLTSSVSVLSSFMNNTPVVALLIPYVYRWSKKTGISPSKLMIPLSYSAIFGGMITIIGTSTNLVLNGFIEAENGQPFQLFDFLIPGILVSIAGILFLSLFGVYLLPNRKSPNQKVQDNFKEYLIEVAISNNAEVIGKSVTQAGLRNLSGIYLAEIFRNGKWIKAVSPDEVLEQNDRLFFAGDTTQIVEIVKEDSDFIFPKTSKFNLDGKLDVVETLIPYQSNLAGQTLKDAGFRDRYDSAVIAIHRAGEKLTGKLGDITLQYGDLLILTTGKQFEEKSSNDKHLYVIKKMTEIKEKKTLNQNLFLIICAILLGLVLTNIIPFFVGILIALGSMFPLKMFSEKELVKKLNLPLLIILGSSIVIGKALIQTGGAEVLSNHFIQLFNENQFIPILISLYIITVILTSFVTNIASVAIIFPIAFALGNQMNIQPEIFYYTIAFGASACFLTPYSYQTNLMVLGSGNYRFNDFLRIGIPMTIVYSVTFFIWLFLHFDLI